MADTAEISIPQEELSFKAIESNGNGLETMDRREEISKFAVDFLHTLNPKAERDKIEIDIFSKNIFSGSVDSSNALRGYDDMCNMVSFYDEHPEMRVPQRTIDLASERDPESLINPNEKVLFYVDEKGLKGERSTRAERSLNDVIAFSGEKRQGFNTVPLEQPDVYLKSVDDRGKASPIRIMKKFTLEGCDNLMIGGEIIPKEHKMREDGDTFLKSIDLSCNGMLVIMPEAQLLPGPSGAEISLKAKGDIIQSKGSQISVEGIECDSYVWKGGSISNPHPTTERVIIKCNKFDDQRGGDAQPLSPSLFNIEGDEDYHARQVELATELTKNKLGIGPEISAEMGGGAQIKSIESSRRVHAVSEKSDQDPEQTTEGVQVESASQEEEQTAEDLENAFDAKYKPTIEMLRKAEKGGSGKIVRGYSDIEADPEKVTMFITEAVAEGWNVANASQVGTLMSVTLEKGEE